MSAQTTQAVKISPTFLSTDLLTPQVPRRITFPSIGYFEPAHRARIWGTGGTKYGGVGKLPFLGHVSNDRNIIISRSHRHYSCGVHDIKAPPQPYDVTSLTLSACRMNDQILPAPLVAVGSQQIEEKKQEEPWPEHVRHLYTSHMCRFEVFPRFDPYRTVFDVPASRKIRQTLTPRTTKALEDLAQSTYRSTLYQTSFTDWSGREEHGTSAQVHAEPDLLREQESQNEQEKQKEDAQIVVPRLDCASEEPTTDKEDIPIKEDVQLNEDPCVDDEVLCPGTVVETENLPEVESTLKAPEDLGRHLEAGLIRPSRFSSLEKSSPSPPKPGLLLKEEPCEAVLESSFAMSLNLPPLSTGDDSSTLFLPRPRNNVMDPIAVTLPSIERVTAGARNGLHRKVRRPSIHGMRFKSEAHKKYHQIYPDLVPDLRQSTTLGKRHFFSGFHACILR